MEPGQIDEALDKALAHHEAGHLAEAEKLTGLQFSEPEPLPRDNPLWDLENVVITPHSSAIFRGWEQRTFQWFCDNLERWRAGAALRNVVDPARGY